MFGGNWRLKYACASYCPPIPIFFLNPEFLRIVADYGGLWGTNLPKSATIHQIPIIWQIIAVFLKSVKMIF